MFTNTISLRAEAYEKLRRVRSRQGESFGDAARQDVVDGLILETTFLVDLERAFIAERAGIRVGRGGYSFRTSLGIPSRYATISPKSSTMS
jgi:hypothetical protein